MRRLPLALLALPAPALADVTLTEFKVEPSSLQAGGHVVVPLTMVDGRGKRFRSKERVLRLNASAAGSVAP